MCHATLGGGASGGVLDVHSGGCDLRFPHHDNEIAQSEAFLETDQWVNYFVHTGHLNIDGLKMSKSLKNFVKIGAALERYGARALRLLFLMYKYNAPMDYSDAVMELVAGIERPFDEFFQNVKGALRGLAVDGRAKWGPRELAFAAALEAAKAAVHAALCDDFDTPVSERAARAQVRERQRRKVCVGQRQRQEGDQPSSAAECAGGGRRAGRGRELRQQRRRLAVAQPRRGHRG